MRDYFRITGELHNGISTSCKKTWLLLIYKDVSSYGVVLPIDVKFSIKKNLLLYTPYTIALILNMQTERMKLSN